MILSLSDTEKEAINNLIKFASAKTNWYDAKNAWSPGDRPEYCVGLTQVFRGEKEQYLYRCVFTWTVSKGEVYRHLSLSYAIPGRLPNALILYTIAHLFGFRCGKMSGDVAIEAGEWDSRVVDGVWEVIQSVSEETKTEN